MTSKSRPIQKRSNQNAASKATPKKRSAPQPAPLVPPPAGRANRSDRPQLYLAGAYDTGDLVDSDGNLLVGSQLRDPLPVNHDDTDLESDVETELDTTEPANGNGDGSYDDAA